MANLIRNNILNPIEQNFYMMRHLELVLVLFTPELSNHHFYFVRGNLISKSDTALGLFYKT